MEFPLLESLAGVLAIAYLVLLFTTRPIGSVSKTRMVVYILLDIALLAINWIAGNWFLFTIWLICLIIDGLKASDVS
jgi:hypothetical protein